MPRPKGEVVYRSPNNGTVERTAAGKLVAFDDQDRFLGEFVNSEQQLQVAIRAVENAEIPSIRDPQVYGKDFNLRQLWDLLETPILVSKSKTRHVRCRLLAREHLLVYSYEDGERLKKGYTILRPASLELLLAPDSPAPFKLLREESSDD